MTGDKHDVLELGRGQTLDSEQGTLQHKGSEHDKHDVLELGRGQTLDGEQDTLQHKGYKHDRGQT